MPFTFDFSLVGAVLPLHTKYTQIDIKIEIDIETAFRMFMYEGILWVQTNIYRNGV